MINQFRKSFIIIGVAGMLLGGWYVLSGNKAKEYKIAFATKVGDTYQLKFTGREYPMAHDPVAMLLREPHEVTYVLNVPRITGVVDGSEISVKKGSYQHMGSISFSGNKMRVDLYFDNFDDNRKDPSALNGEYTLIANEPAQ